MHISKGFPVHLAPGYAVNALVVDDVENNRDVLGHMLQTAGITVRTAVLENLTHSSIISSLKDT